jgi:uncharacterized protein YndB with AHSA1/START domain
VSVLDRGNAYLGIFGKGDDAMSARNSGSNAALRDRRELVVQRTIDAPRGDVFRAWTDAACLARWWGPRGFTNPVCEVEAREAGAIRIDMRGPDGTIYPMAGVFGEIVVPEKLVFLSAALNDDGHPLFETENVVTFVERQEKTSVRVVARLAWWWPEAPPYLEGMEEGWEQSLERLAKAVAKSDPERA